MALRVSGAPVLRAWDSLGNGALFTTRIPGFVTRQDRAVASLIWKLPKQQRASLGIVRQTRCLSLRSELKPSAGKAHPSLRALIQCRGLQQSTQKRETNVARQEAQEAPYLKGAKRSSDPADEDLEEDETQIFKKTERAAQASQINLSAKLSSPDKDGKYKTSGGWKEIVRLLKIARPEVRTLGLAFVFLLISSSVSMALPFSIGKILDAATQESGTLFGLQMEHFFIVLGALLTAGACANYGRIILLRIVGERVVMKLRSSLFRRTFVQNAEFFDANRVGDLISRLGSDTIIVGKSITQNVSDGLRSLSTLR